MSFPYEPRKMQTDGGRTFHFGTKSDAEKEFFLLLKKNYRIEKISTQRPTDATLSIVVEQGEIHTEKYFQHFG